MKDNLIGIDIGGTKVAVIYGVKDGDSLNIEDKIIFPTTNYDRTVRELFDTVQTMMSRHSLISSDVAAIGVSCGGPLDSKRGLIMSPPNLPGWDNVPITDMITERFGIKAGVQNDANACALAEWKFGAGIGTQNMIFMTFGTGLGAGLVLDGQLYAGTNDNAGEVGHIRLSDFGPVGYGKTGSFEGFCSGSGIAQIARVVVWERIQMGEKPILCDSVDKLGCITAKSVAEAADAGDEVALEVYRISGTYLGRGLSLLIDILNPELIVIGGVFARSGHLLEPYAWEVIRNEALSHARNVCSIKPAGLGESIGDYAALSVAANLL